MPEIQKVKIAVNTSKGNVLQENNDRYLVGMDPASNDWLFSPDETIIGEFGVLLLLADGIGNEQEGGFAASIITQTVKKLFNQTLELPPDDEGIVRLLRKFFLIAHKQLIWEQEHNVQLVYPAAAAAMVLVRDHKMYGIWCGNTRIYRWSKRKLQGAFTFSSEQFECISIDHTIENNQRLYKKGSQNNASDSDLKPLHFLGQKDKDPQISFVVLPISKGDRVFLSTEGIYKTIPDESLSRALSNEGEIESITEDLITSAFNSGSPLNSSAIILELTEGLSFANERKLDAIEIEENARIAFGPLVELPEIKESEPEQRIRLKSGLKFKDKPKDPEIEPMKVRTVLPDPETTEEPPKKIPEDSIQTGLDFKQPVQEPYQESVPEPIGEDSNAATDQELTEEVKPMYGTQESGSIEKDFIAEKEDSLGEKRSKLRIKVTVYPDQDPVPPTPDTSGNVPLEDLDNPIELDPEDAFESEASGFIDKAINDLPETDSLIDNQLEEEEFETLDDEELSEEEPEEEGPDPYIEGEEVDSHIIEVHDDEDQEDSSDIVESVDEDQEKISSEFETEESQSEEQEQEHLILTEDAEEINTEINSEELHDDQVFEEPVVDSEEDEEVDEDIALSKKSVTITEDWPFGEEEAANPLPLSSTEENKVEEEQSQQEAEETIGIPISAAADNPIDNNQDGNESDSYGSSIESDGKHWEKIKGFWPYFLVLLALFTLPLWICGKENDIEIPEQSSGLPEKPIREVPEIPISEPPIRQEQENPKENDQKQDQTPVAAEKKEEPKPTEKKQKEPEYDSQIQEHKHQLIDEVKALKKDKDILCKKVSTYQKNAPSGKQDRLVDLVESCDQLDKKFTSIYDSRTGYLQAVRYDFLNGTIRNIKVSMEQLEKQLDIIRAETSN